MDFHADDYFPVAGGAGDEAFGVGRAGINEGHVGTVKELGWAFPRLLFAAAGSANAFGAVFSYSAGARRFCPSRGCSRIAMTAQAMSEAPQAANTPVTGRKTRISRAKPGVTTAETSRKVE